jgi:hypothetical protein
MRTILAVGQDENLLHITAEMLRKCAGKAEVVAAKATEAMALLKAQLFDLVVLCHPLRMEELIPIVTLAHNQGVEVKLLKIARPSEAAADYESIAADEIVFADAKTFMEKVEKMLSAPPHTLKVH